MLSSQVGFLSHIAGFGVRRVKDLVAGFALDDYCELFDYRGPVPDDQGVGRFRRKYRTRNYDRQSENSYPRTLSSR